VWAGAALSCVVAPTALSGWRGSGITESRPVDGAAARRAPTIGLFMAGAAGYRRTMGAMSLAVTFGFAVALVVTVHGLLVRAALLSRDRSVRSLIGLSVLLYLLAAGALTDHREATVAALVVAGAAAAVLAVWVARRGEDDEGGGGGGGGGPKDDRPDMPPGPSGLIDWESFDRARAGWRPREPVA
jgi:hypothetical protein